LMMNSGLSPQFFLPWLVGDRHNFLLPLLSTDKFMPRAGYCGGEIPELLDRLSSEVSHCLGHS
jgi:hypothetical protein